MYNRTKSVAFQRNTDSFIKHKSIPINFWITHGSFIGDFRSIQQVVKCLNIFKKTIKTHLNHFKPYFPKKGLYGLLFFLQ